MQTCKNFFFWVLLTLCTSAYTLTAQNIGIDATFATNGRFFYNEVGTREEGISVLEQPDGKVIIVGVTDYDPDEGNNSRIIVIRLNALGSLDNSFGTNGKVYIDTPNSSDISAATVLQNDGKIIICGGQKVYRLNSNGSLDNAFGKNGIATIEPESVYSLYNVKVQPDGKIVTSGSGFIDVRFSYLIARFNPDGRLDKTFNGNGYNKFRTSTLSTEEDNEAGYGLAIQSDGKIVSCGSDEKGNGTVARLNNNGPLDQTFGSGGIKNFDFTRRMDLYSVAIQPDGKILVGGNYDFSSSLLKAQIMRLLPNGNFDNSFSNVGFSWYGSSSGLGIGYDMVLQCDGKILIGGLSHLNRILPNGVLDPAFGNNGHFSISSVSTADIYALHIGVSKIYLIGNEYPAVGSSDLGIGLLRLNNNVNCGTISADDLENNVSVSMYPNPVRDELMIQVESADDRIKNVVVYDVLGRVVGQNDRNSFDNTSIVYNMSGLVPGNYYVVITTHRGQQTLPLIKI